jgi:hypothetical protein
MSLTAAFEGDFSNWRGLTGEETLDSVKTSYQPVQIHAPVEKPRKNSRYDVVVMERDNTPTQIEVWFRVGEKTVTLIEYDHPVGEKPIRFLEQYGEPDELYKSKRLALGLIVRDYIYSGRGLTLTVGKPYQPNEEDEPLQILHVELYSSTTAEDYLTKLENGPEIRPYPPSNG